MRTDEAPTMIRLNDEAYERWNGGDLDWVDTKQRFWLALNPLQRDAVVITNLVGQVRNGGFGQWHDNGYSAAYDYVTYVLDRMPQSDITARMRNLLQNVAEDIEEHEGDEELDDRLDEYDDEFYRIDSAFLEEAERFFIAQAGKEA